jgi:enamine deaminase RidA (YjgF/YER057c/UK114 family)
VEAVLAANGASMNSVVMVRVFLTADEHFDAMNEVYCQMFSEPFPARTTVYVGLPEGFLVEIDGLAVAEDRDV